ncbi:MAG: HPr family phosphocarrier protein [Halieaceae bacterium]|jgi:phosphocarrier protein HPr|nr:HPr family phosphocarrier protein [Halieaceae bacterium]
MIQRELDIINKLGLHARAAAKLVECAARFGCRIQLRKDEASVDAKSIMAVMMLAASQGTRLTLCCDGEDEEAACKAIETLIAERFGEPE